MGTGMVKFDRQTRNLKYYKPVEVTHVTDVMLLWLCRPKPLMGCLL